MARQLICNIWKTMLELWSTRTEIIYATDAEMKKRQIQDKLIGRLKRCYEYKNRLQAHERTHWFAQPIEALTQKDQEFIEARLGIVERLIRINHREQKARPPESKIMEQFLSINNEHTQPRHKRNKRNLAQEMQPDITYPPLRNFLAFSRNWVLFLDSSRKPFPFLDFSTFQKYGLF
jgi:hypothetical protein